MQHAGCILKEEKKNFFVSHDRSLKLQLDTVLPVAARHRRSNGVWLSVVPCATAPWLTVALPEVQRVIGIPDRCADKVFFSI